MKEDNKLQENRLTSFVNRIALYPTAPEYCPEREEAGKYITAWKNQKKLHGKGNHHEDSPTLPLQIPIGKNDKIEKNTSISTPAGSHFSLLIT
ncbi:hypothetical protein [Prevotella denticola]|uniref:hypothetical protein n=1 Tax=Prevotella denticola TaxID=28129 RepID=UPI0028DCBE6F|nr:hypothetical protein [Prevotella denticola]